MEGRAPRAKRSLGQNFLVDANLQRKIVEALEAGPEDEVLEVGPGRGALTRHLVGAVRRLVLVELDDALAAELRTRWGARDDVEVVHGDVLEVVLAEHLTDPERARVIGNIPYNITTPILFRLLERPRPRVIVVMVQEEVADRIVADVGTKAYGALSIGVRTVADAERLFRVGPRAFRPVPGVASAIVRITPTRPELLGAEEEGAVRRLVRSAFQWRRKQLFKTLRDHPDLDFQAEAVGVALAAVGLRGEDRPEQVTPEQFVALARSLEAGGRTST